MIGVVNDVPVNMLVPPVDAVYQFTTPDEAVAPNTTVPVPQLLLLVVPVIVGIAFTVTLIKLLIAGDAPVHGALGVKTKEITSFRNGNYRTTR